LSTDPVNHPAHYTTGTIECIDAMEAMLTADQFRGYLRGNAFKYGWRYQYKGGIEDLLKQRWYNERLLAFEQEEAAQ
jgi:hypothetical protein